MDKKNKNIIILDYYYVSLAQLVEQWSPKPQVGSSSLSTYAIAMCIFCVLLLKFSSKWNITLEIEKYDSLS